MSDATPSGQPTEPELGIGALLSRTFGMVHGHLPVFLMLCVPLALITPVLDQLLHPATLLDPSETTDLGTYTFSFDLTTAQDLALMIIEFVIWALVAAGATHAAYRFRLGYSVNLPAAYATMVRFALPLSLLMVVTGICIVLGFLALVLPGLYLNALWFVVVPAVVVERKGLGALSRSVELTSGYRWPLVGLFVVYLLVLIVVGLCFAFLLELVTVPLSTALGSISAYVTGILTGVLDGYFYAIGAVMAAETYARLVDIKEGVTVNELAAVFE